MSQFSAQAQCDACVTFGPGTPWGNISISPLSEASGLAASARNPGVLWTHNDGSRERVYAFSTNGAHLANFDFNQNVSDVEDVAVGPGPVPGTSYLYLGDIGGNGSSNSVRAQVRVLRIGEPLVQLAWAGDSRSSDFDNVETFTLAYPDGSFDAEALMVDPITADVFVITKQDSGARVYRANLNTSVPGVTVTMQFVRSVGFAVVSAADISADGTQIVFRHESFAMVWRRCDKETIGVALARAGLSIPVVGPPSEANGEGIAFLRDRTGYMTISEGSMPALYFFQAQCPTAPRFTQSLGDQSGFLGASVEFTATVVGYPSPAYEWFFNGQPIGGQESSSLVIASVTAANAGQYQLIASNESGIVTSTATLTVRPKPDVRITEVQSSTAPSPSVPTADWWELTSFEAQPVSLASWRFNDNGGGLDDPFTFPPGLVIGPGESIVFAEELTATQFRNWWGAANLPASLQVVSYGGSGLSLGAGGDGIRLWNDMVINPLETIAAVDFGAAQNGISFNYDPNTGQFGLPSQLGVNGVFRAAASSGDIGSPGRIAGPATPVTLSAVLSGSMIRIEFDAVAGRVYTLETRELLSTGDWVETGDSLEATTSGRVFFEKTATADARFFRVHAE